MSGCVKDPGTTSDLTPEPTLVQCFYCGDMIDESTARRGGGMLFTITACQDAPECIARHEAKVRLQAIVDGYNNARKRRSR